MMTLQEAIEEVRRDHASNGDWDAHELKKDTDRKTLDAIATILNAVVKGELKNE